MTVHRHNGRRAAGRSGTVRPSPLPPVAGILCAAGAVAGSLLVWATVDNPTWGPAEVSGMDGDGRYTLWLAVGAGVLHLAAIVTRIPLWSVVAALPAAGAAAWAALNAFDPERSARIYAREGLGRSGQSEDEIVSVLLGYASAPGVWLTAAAAALCALTALWSVAQAGGLVPDEEDMRTPHEEAAKR
ncbi:hypothetical protein [Streptomyces sp. RFCAC02]|uniref:hypothetical protein n=1 Tax=Streptomyces sp. RFCAC02 TaxID=2499143 RepID=UPI00102122AE|nr:hypothetical protein [Streptomyces sp. RFCAC02]